MLPQAFPNFLTKPCYDWIFLQDYWGRNVYVKMGECCITGDVTALLHHRWHHSLCYVTGGVTALSCRRWRHSLCYITGDDTALLHHRWCHSLVTSQVTSQPYYITACVTSQVPFQLVLHHMWHQSTCYITGDTTVQVTSQHVLPHRWE